MEEFQTYRGMVITAESLAKRWVGMHEDMFTQHLEDAINEVPSDFPSPLRSKGTRRDSETGEHVTTFASWKSEGKRAKSAIQRYQRDAPGGRRAYGDLLGEIVFKFSDVENFEEKHPDVLDKLIDPDKDLARFAEMGETPLTRAQLEQKLRKAHADIEHFEAQIEELEAQIEDMQHGHGKSTNKNWQESTKTAFKLWVKIFEGEKRKWTQDEFRAALKDIGNCLSQTRFIAWTNLPLTFKHTGRPPKTL